MERETLEQMLQAMNQQRDDAFTTLQQANGAIQILEHLLNQLDSEHKTQPEEIKQE